MDDISQTLRAEYDAYETEIAVRGKTLRFLQAKEIEGALDGVCLGGKGPREFPFWLRIWEASVVLANFVAAIPQDGEKDWLEIGAGMGVTGAFAAAFGHRIRITDNNEKAIQFAKANAALNGLHHVDFDIMDWSDPPVDQKYHYIIGAEVVYRDDLFGPLKNLFMRLLHDDGIVYLAGDVTRKSPLTFFDMLKSDFEIAGSTHTLKNENEEHAIGLFRLRFRQ